MRLYGSPLALAASLLAPLPALAVPITASYSVDALDSDPGLVVSTEPVAENPFTVDLEEGDSVTFDLFSIWTDESVVNSDDGVYPGDITVSFDFLAPEPASVDVTGITVGVFALIASFGDVDWDGPDTTTFGALGDGSLQIALSDTTFNAGAFGDNLYEGKEHAGTVQATLSWLPASQVPEPASLGLMGLGLVGLGALGRRKAA
ncbi:PEP-CTERM sorting domain-containing protein [Marinobacteraceae bacterium S3BR75-40.1]